jgi:hypothetical protein
LKLIHLIEKYQLKHEIIEMDLDYLDILVKKRKLENSTASNSCSSSSTIHLFENHNDVIKTTNEIILIQIHK